MNAQPSNQIIIENEQLRLIIDDHCIVKSLISKSSGDECIMPDEEVALFSATQNRPYNNENKLIYMNKRTTYQANRVHREGNHLVIGFEIVPFEAIVEVTESSEYINFTLKEFVADPKNYPDIVMDLPPVIEFRLLQLPVRNREHFGEWLNVAWDNQTSVNVLSAGPFARIDSEKRKGCRILVADAVKEVKLEGCSAALIVSDTEKLLDNVAAVERDYDLPRGVESRRNPMINASIYWTEDLNPENVDEHIMYATKGGFRLMELYFPAVFQNEDGYWNCGDYDIKEVYPGGAEGLKEMLGKIKAAGILPGIHFLHSHIGKRSRYVTPVADHRLHLLRNFTLAKPVEKEDTIIYVEQNPTGSPMADCCRVLQFGGELIFYEAYTITPPYCFIGCSRGYWETNIVSHARGSIGGILDISEYGGESAYLDQYTDLQDEVAEKIAVAYDCGFSFIYFDGSEGTNAPFDYHVPNAQYRVYKRLSSTPLFCEGAAKAHFGWHILSGGNAFDGFPTDVFKEKIDEYPVKDAEYMQNDFTRVNFGWWAYSNDTQPDTYEYGISRAAAWDCPATVVMSLSVLRSNPRTDDILEILRRWEDVRKNNWLTEEQKNAMKSNSQEHILLINEQGEYELVPYEYIADAAGGNSDFRAFYFERCGKQYVVCWHTTGRGVLELPLEADQITYEAEIGGEKIPFEAEEGFVVIPVSGRHYISSSLSKEELLEAVRNTKIVSAI